MYSPARTAIIASFLLCFLAVSALAENLSPTGPVFRPESGFWEFRLASEFQAASTLVRVLLPDGFDPQKKYPVLYVLPVEGGVKTEFGSGLEEAKKTDAANKYSVICVYPSFVKAAPWYGNHATDPEIRQEDFVVRTLVPWVDATYPTRRDKEARWLIGFSKSGWGAFTLLLRHREVFGYAAAWDVPFMLDGDNSGKDWGPMGLSSVFGTKEAMQQNLPTKLAADNTVFLRERCRLVVGMGGYWKPQVKQMHAFLEEQKIPHVYRPDLTLTHRWDTGWFAPMMEELAKIAQAR